MIDRLDYPLARLLVFIPPELERHELDAPKYEPSPEEIIQATAEIRAKWNKTTELSRRCYGPSPAIELTEIADPYIDHKYHRSVPNEF